MAEWPARPELIGFRKVRYCLQSSNPVASYQKMSNRRKFKPVCKFLGFCWPPAIAWLVTATLAFAALTVPAHAKTSGGYSRPSLSASSGSRSPAFRSGRNSRGSGGYARPPLSVPRSASRSSSSGDRAMSRQAAEEALKRWRSKSSNSGL